MKITILETTDAPTPTLETFRSLADRANSFPELFQTVSNIWKRSRMEGDWEILRFIVQDQDGEEARIEIANDFTREIWKDVASEFDLLHQLLKRHKRS